MSNPRPIVFCDCADRQDFLACFDECESQAGLVSFAALSRPVVLPTVTPGAEPDDATKGPGWHLKKLLRSFGIVATANCSCNARARTMDANGCDWCEANLDEIVGWLREEAARRGLPFLDAAGRMLVRRAIANARRQAATAIE